MPYAKQLLIACCNMHRTLDLAVVDTLSRHVLGLSCTSLVRAGAVRRGHLDSAMSGSVWHKVAGVSGAAAVALGAYGAHQFKPEDPYFAEVHTDPTPVLI